MQRKGSGLCGARVGWVDLVGRVGLVMSGGLVDGVCRTAAPRQLQRELSMFALRRGGTAARAAAFRAMRPRMLRVGTDVGVARDGAMFTEAEIARARPAHSRRRRMPCHAAERVPLGDRDES